MPIFPYRMAKNYQTQQLQALLDHTRTLRVFLHLLKPSKYVKYTAAMTYGNWPNRTWMDFFVHHLQFNWPTAMWHKYYLWFLHETTCVHDPRPRESS